MIDCVLRGMSDEEIMELLAEHLVLDHIPKESLTALLKEIRKNVQKGAR